MTESQNTKAISFHQMFLMTFAVCLPTLVTWIYFSLLADNPPALQKSAYTIGKSIQFVLPLVCVFFCGRWAISTAPNFKSSIWIGIVLGIAICAAMYCLYRFALMPLGIISQAQIEVRSKLNEMQIESLSVFIAIACGYALVHSLLEEYYWRWFVFGNLTKLTSFSLAVIISSVGFAAHHVIVLARYFGWSNPWTYILTACIAVGGAIWAWLYHRYGTLLGPWISHGLVDAMIFFIGYELIYC